MLKVTEVDKGFKVESDFSEEIERVRELIQWIRDHNAIPTILQWTERREDAPDRF
jgi:hypothetical protein